MTAGVVRVSRVVPAPRDRVFEAWTDPRAVERWWGRPEGAAVVVTEMDARPGGSFRIVTDAGGGGVLPATGTYLEVVAPERIVFLFAWEHPLPLPGGDAGPARVTVELRDLGESTEVVVIHEGQPSPEMHGFHATGWTWSLDGLAEVLRGP